jgi:aryl-alcohol dehydrogenase-like predicted oxidoreductase
VICFLYRLLAPTLTKPLASRRKANISNIAQRFVLQTKSVASVLIGVRNTDHISENTRTHSFSLSSDEMEAIEKVVALRSGPKGDVWDIERGYVSG